MRLDSTIEYMHDIEPPNVWSIRVDGHNLVAPVMQTFPRFPHLHTISATPVTSRSMVYEQDTHD